MCPQARYFPIGVAPLKMVAGLSRHGVDYGQGAADQQFFQRDERRAAYLAAKRRAPDDRRGSFGADAAASLARSAALLWMHDTLAREQPEVLAEVRADGGASDGFDALARNVQEDFAVLAAGDECEGRTVALDVRFPSGWRPERLAGASFAALHRPVPGFMASQAAVQSMVRAMIERGPYVRFVWTLCTNDELDQHPDVRPAADWARAARLYLRVERQITVPLPAAYAAVFLIRTYVYPCAELTYAQRKIVAHALAVMPPEVRAYKGLPQLDEVQHVLLGARAMETSAV